MMIKKWLDSAVDESLADQEIHKSNMIGHNLWKFASLHLAELGLKAGRQMKFGGGITF